MDRMHNKCIINVIKIKKINNERRKQVVNNRSFFCENNYVVHLSNIVYKTSIIYYMNNHN